MSGIRLFIAGLLLALSGLALADVPAVSAVTPAPGAIPFKHDKQATGSLAYQSFAGLVLDGLAACGIVLGLKRYGGKLGGRLGQTRRVQMLEAIRLSRRSTLYVVQYQGQELLLAESEHGIALVSGHVPPAEPIAPGGSDA